MKKVIVNSTPIISLSILEKLNILKELFDEIIIPQAVYNEIVKQGNNKVGSKELKNANWIKIKKITNISLKESIMLELDEGEAEVITIYCKRIKY